MKTILLIGIGPGDPDALTLAAIKAIGRADVFFFLEKEGEGKDSLIRFRQQILQTHRGDQSYRTATVALPERDRETAGYVGAVEDWHRRRTALIATLIDTEMAEGETAGMLIWGDPSLYDGAIQHLRDLIESGRADLSFEVIPGITSIQMLAARHKIPLNRIGESITITTGRQIEQADPASITNAVVMLDSRAAFRRLEGAGDVDIYWGGDVGGPDEILIAGPLDAVADRIERAIALQRARKGWIMDNYLLRRRPQPS
ncbi:precorrin-6A synthase (deacetylating) [Magnetospirillum fulvum]|uniref:Precorrin-6A synthase [deacetylating] n=1 Tax=Magnetospirillum fulvum TaxID=1082 RepID=A0A1H6IXM4_MAGFU|nr:precorrin-6A synthase (deacetylating) [Magnetospirillum fulvum]SEH51297.1 precorrin-6A synthase (deacetylating) [Magnetospirillum fulvum]